MFQVFSNTFFALTIVIKVQLWEHLRSDLPLHLTDTGLFHTPVSQNSTKLIHFDYATMILTEEAQVRTK